MHRLPPSPRACRAAFTLAELMVAVGIVVIGGGVAYPLLTGDIGLYARNFSINKSNNSLRYSLQMLKRDIDMSLEPPMLMNYSVSGATGVLTPADTTNAAGVTTTYAVSAQAIMIWVNLGPAYDLVPTAGANATDTTVNPAATITLKRHAADGDSPASPMPQVGDRLIVLSPGPYTTGMPDIVSMNGVKVQKPGRRIINVNGATANPVADNGSATITVKLDLSTTTWPPSASNPIYGKQSIYVAREMAYVACTINDAAGKPAERRLLSYASTQNMTAAQVLISDLDPAPQEQVPASWINAAGPAVVQPFNYYANASNLGGGRRLTTPLNVNLPVRALDYAHAVAERNVASGQVNISSEFNVFLRSAPQMGAKVRPY